MDELSQLTTITAIFALINLLRKRQRVKRLQAANILGFYYGKQKQKPYSKKTAWTFEMHNLFWELAVPEMNKARFKAKYRIEKSTSDYLVDVLNPHIERQNTKIRSSIPVDKRLAKALHCLKSGADYDTISTAYDVRKAICKVLGAQKIKLPTPETDLEEVVFGFNRRWNFPGCVGACDGTYFPILSPTYCPEDYYNYKGWKSMHALALVDHKYIMFRYVSAGAAGKNSDSSVYSNSPLSSEPIRNKFFPEKQSYHIIRDSAFSLTHTMMKPYPEHRGLTPKQFHFNYRLSRARMVVECAFGRLKARWRILMKRCDLKTEDMPIIIMTCCILHNICEERSDEVIPSWMSEYIQHLEEFPIPTTSNSRDYNSSATEKRDDLANALFNDGANGFLLNGTDETIFHFISNA